MSQGYQQLGMVAQLGNDPSALDEQQQALALAQQQATQQQQQLALAQQQQQQLALAQAQQQQQTAQQPPQQLVTTLDQPTTLTTQLGVSPSAMQSAVGYVRDASVQSFATAPEDEDLLSEDSLVVSPDHKRPARARAGARSLSGPRSKKKATITGPLAGRPRSDSAARPPRLKPVAGTGLVPVP
jgi:ABC-type uncharacterized transport system permease subunit